MTKSEKWQEKEPTNLEAIRKALGLTQQELANELKVAISTISRCERGETDIRLTFEQWLKLANLVRYRLNKDVRDWPSLKLNLPEISKFPLDN